MLPKSKSNLKATASRLAPPSKSTSSRTSNLLAWSSQSKNQIRIVELETKKKFASFEGTKLLCAESNSIFLVIT